MWRACIAWFDHAFLRHSSSTSSPRRLHRPPCPCAATATQGWQRCRLAVRNRAQSPAQSAPGATIETSARVRLGIPARAAEFDVDAIVERLDAQSLRELLQAALLDLPAGQRRAIELRIVRELDYEEVASELGTTVVAARIRVMRALKSLAEILKGVQA